MPRTDKKMGFGAPRTWSEVRLACRGVAREAGSDHCFNKACSSVQCARLYAKRIFRAAELLPVSCRQGSMQSIQALPAVYVTSLKNAKVLLYALEASKTDPSAAEDVYPVGWRLRRVHIVRMFMRRSLKESLENSGHYIRPHMEFSNRGGW